MNSPLFFLTILGSNSALPLNGRHPTSQVLQVNNSLYLIDCGEGSQMRMELFGIKKHRIDHIFISHLHGDHVLGLMGLLSSFSLNGRKNKLHLYSPKGLEEFITTQIRLTESYLSYPILFHVIDTDQSIKIMEDSQIEVFSIPLKHRIATTGYLFKEKKRLPNIIGEKIEAYQIPYSDIMNIKHGAGFCTQDGKIIPHEELVNMPPLPRSYAFCSDTLYLETILPIIQGVDLLYHEATFMHEAVERATQTGHSTALQAGMIAAQAKVKKLLLGHFSIRYGDLSLLQKEAQRVFPNTEIAVEGSVWHIGE